MSLVLAALLQPGMFQYTFKDQFAPVALGFLALERAGEVGGFVRQAQVQLLQAFKLLGQRETFTRFVLVAFFHALFEGLDTFLEWVEQLAEAFLAGFGKALFTFVEDLPCQLGELRAQLVPRALQVGKALLMAFLLFAQFGTQRG